MKKLILLILCTLPGLALLGQQTIEVSGQVTDPDGGGIPGVTIQIKGTQQGAITDLEGNYTIQHPPTES